MLKDFRQFILRGNVVDLAIAVVIGAAFSGVVQSLVKDLITPLIAAIYKQQQFSNAYFTVHGSRFLYGDFINTVISFLIVSSVVFFLIVRPVNHIVEYYHRNDATPDPTTRKCPECLSEIPVEARRCKFCTAHVKPETASKN